MAQAAVSPAPTFRLTRSLAKNAFTATQVTPAKLFIGQCRDEAKMLDEGIKIAAAVEQAETAFDAARGYHGIEMAWPISHKFASNVFSPGESGLLLMKGGGE
ncbi:hypothetical protein PG1C_05600 [Rugosibacter aromaticivorans]|uniref:Uncharacterized protein n=1 Tax=Rugosibacter aromaticivorans TaxID=1565605 RepID=A0A0C5J818_9PROT|nr:hypothetical protein [Rugosibacter aromaticivorans]AJP48080.1 hypothetical protein PG1C_05600 [Rugosibacter aromaticivorans]